MIGVFEKTFLTNKQVIQLLKWQKFQIKKLLAIFDSEATEDEVKQLMKWLEKKVIR
jgi:hypothetical protein